MSAFSLGAAHLGGLRKGERLPALFWMGVAVMLAAHLGGAVRLLYPVAALLVALQLAATGTAGYVSFVIWLWALSPLVRRIADSQAGWQEASLVLLTPYLASAAGVVRAVAAAALDPRRVARFPHRPAMFVLALVGIFCGVPLGFAAGTPGAQIEALNWIVPVLFGAYLATCVEEAGAIERTVVATFWRVAIVVGLYGAYQFLRLPSWDALWMVSSEMTSIGQAEALAVRVFSTMHSPGVLGYFIMLPVVFWLARPAAITLLPACLASVALLLSQVRSAWAGLGVAALLVAVRMQWSSAVRVVLLAAFGSLCVLPFLQLPDVAERVNARIETFKDMPNFDESASARTAGYALTLDYMERHPFGAGVGANPVELDVVGVRDSTVISGFVQFGVVGMTIYAAALVLMAQRIAVYYWRAPNRDALGIAAGAIGLLSVFMLGIPTAAQPGVLTWMAAGLATARLAASESASSYAVPSATAFATAAEEPGHGPLAVQP